MTTLKYSKINQCFFLMFHDQLIETYASRAEAVARLGYNGLGVTSSGTVKKLDEN